MNDSIHGSTLSQRYTEVPEALQEPKSTKNMLFLSTYSLANMALGVGNIAIPSILLPMQVVMVSSGDQTRTFSLILGLGALAAVLASPLAGMLSDRTTSRWGRRRPWLVVGGTLTVFSLLLLAIAPSLLIVALGYLSFKIVVTLIQMALSAILPDQVPIHQRATVSAFTAGLGVLLGGLIGQILVARFFTHIPAAYTSLAITIAIMIAVFLLVLRDAPLPKGYTPSLRITHVLGMLKPLAHRDFALTWGARCLALLGYTTVVSFMFYYLQDAVHYSKVFPGQTTAQGVQTFFAINVVSVIIASLAGGIISDKLQRRKLFVIISSIIMAVGLFTYAFFPIWSMVLVGTTILGIGTGIFLSVDLALASQVLPTAEDRGKDISIINTAVLLPTVLSPVIAGITLNILHSYLALFSLLGVAALLAAVLITPIKSVR